MNITGNTTLTGLLGSPVAHSLSPYMHNQAFQLLGLDYVYLAFDVKETDLPAAVRGLKSLNIRGFNLTMPHKTAVMELVDELTPVARLAGSCNTVIQENGRLIGHTTDGAGFLRSVAEKGLILNQKQMTILGAGGAAKAIIAQAALDGASGIHIFRRNTPEAFRQTEAFAKRITLETSCPVRVFDLTDTHSLSESLASSTLFVNATNVGMAPASPNESPLPDGIRLPSHLTVADIIYNPQTTRFLHQAKAAGCNIIPGLYMLLYQGAAAFHCWTGQDMPVESIKKDFEHLLYSKS